jgi:hypothetical protein
MRMSLSDSLIGARRLLSWAKRPGEKAATWANDTYLEVPGLGDDGGVWVNHDSYIPDVPSLDPQIFTSRIKPFFEYHEVPLAMLPRGTTAVDQQQGNTERNPPVPVYKYVEPSAAVTLALNQVGMTVMPAEPSSVQVGDQPVTSEESPSNRFIPTDTDTR